MMMTMDLPRTSQPIQPALVPQPAPAPVSPVGPISPPIRNNWPLVVLCAVILILSYLLFAWSGGIWPFSTNKVSVSSTPSASATPDPTADWKTYTNSQYGFEFKYPKQFYLGGGNYVFYDPLIKKLNKNLEDPQRGPGFIASNGFLRISVIENTPDIAARTAEDDRIDSLPVGSISKQNDETEEVIEINGAKGVKLVHRDYPDTERYVIEAIFHDKRHTQIILATNFEDGETLEQIYQDPLLSTFHQILSTFKFTTASSIKNTFLSSFYNLEFTLPAGYFVESNQYGVTDAVRAESFFFRKESSNYGSVPVLDVSADLKLSSGQTLQQLAKSIYNMNKSKGYTTTDLKSGNYGGVTAYEFGLQSGYVNPDGGQLLDSPGGKVIFLYKNGKIFQFLQTGVDSGLTGILNSLKFK